MHKSNYIKAILIILITICIIVAGIFGYLVVNKFLNDKKSRDTYTAVSDKVTNKNTNKNNNIDKKNRAPINIDWEELRSINEDVIGWIYVETLDINYPIMRTNDNDFYLHRNLYKEWLYAGSIFLDMNNSTNFSDPNSIVYGHNMMDGSMFGHLGKIITESIANENPYFWILTPNGNYEYKIFTAFETDVNSDAYSFFIRGDNTFKDWAQKMQDRSFINFPEYIPETEDFIVSLSTCSYADNIRTLVMGYCISKEKP